MKELKTTAERLKFCRLKKELSLQDVADYLGVNKTTVGRWENGSTGKINLSTIASLAYFFGVSEAWLSGKDVNMNDSKSISIPHGFEPVPKMNKKPRLGAISCGEPIDSAENFDGYDNVPERIRCDFTLKAEGDSMTGARINDGDIVYIRQQETAESGQIAAVLLDGSEKLLKRIYINSDNIILQAENPRYSPLVFSGAEMNRIRIIGIAVGFTSVI